jgi:hypothetical protein
MTFIPLTQIHVLRPPASLSVRDDQGVKFHVTTTAQNSFSLEL